MGGATLAWKALRTTCRSPPSRERICSGKADFPKVCVFWVHPHEGVFRYPPHLVTSSATQTLTLPSQRQRESSDNFVWEGCPKMRQGAVHQSKGRSALTCWLQGRCAYSSQGLGSRLRQTPVGRTLVQGWTQRDGRGGKQLDSRSCRGAIEVTQRPQPLPQGTAHTRSPSELLGSGTSTGCTHPLSPGKLEEMRPLDGALLAEPPMARE